jgi:hypothetical protein
MVAETIHLWDSKCAFGRIDAEAVGGQHIKNLSEMEEMLFPGRTENEEVVKVDEKERERTEKGIHEPLERLGGVFEAKWHEVKFKETKGRDYGCFWNVVFLHRHLIISLFQIQFGENSGTVQMS